MILGIFRTFRVMKSLTILLFVCFVHSSKAQTLYDPQTLYDAPGGLMDYNILRSMNITFYDPAYDSILHDNWINELGLRLPATVQLDGGQFYANVMVRYKGNSTYSIPSDQGNPKVPYNLDFNDSISGQTLLGYNKVKLANAVFDPTFVKEITAYDIYRRYLPSPQASLMQLNVQGDYLGLYVNTEAIDRQFLTKHFGENDGVLFKCDPIQQFGQGGPTGNSDLKWLGSDSTLYYNHYGLKSDSGWDELVNLMDVLNNDPANLDTVLNIDRVLWAFAVNQAILNLDTYNGLFQHNYYLYKTEDGLFQMIPWDVSESFLGALLGMNANTTELYEYDPYNGYNSLSTPLSLALTSDPNSHYGKIYSAHLRTVINESLNATEIESFVDNLQVLGATAVSADPNKLFGMAQYYSNVDNELVIPFIFSAGGIISSVDLRKPYLESLPSISATPPVVGDPVVLTQQGTFGENYVTAQVSNANSVELMATISPYNSKFVSVPMLDDGTNGDLVSGDGNYTAAFPWVMSGNPTKFYIRANNTNATMLNPERAEYEFWTYDLPLATENPVANLVVSMYPNPTTDYVMISIPSGASLKYSITNSMGSEVRKGMLNTGKIDVSSFANGIYFVQFCDENGRRLTKKLIVQ